MLEHVVSEPRLSLPDIQPRLLQASGVMRRAAGLLLDEPTAALDAATGIMVERLIANWIQEQSNERATVWVSHDMEQAVRVSDRIIHMAQEVVCIPK